MDATLHYDTECTHKQLWTQPHSVPMCMYHVCVQSCVQAHSAANTPALAMSCLPCSLPNSLLEPRAMSDRLLFSL